MAKLSSGMADKLKNLARGLKEEDKPAGVKKLGDAVKNAETRKKIVNDGKVSGRKN